MIQPPARPIINAALILKKCARKNRWITPLQNTGDLISFPPSQTRFADVTADKAHVLKEKEYQSGFVAGEFKQNNYSVKQPAQEEVKDGLFRNVKW